MYLFGVEVPDCLAVIELDTNKTTLFIPNQEKYRGILTIVAPEHLLYPKIFNPQRKA